MIRSRKNAMYYSKYDYPLFTVMDEVKPFTKGMKFRPGLYYIETELYISDSWKWLVLARHDNIFNKREHDQDTRY